MKKGEILVNKVHNLLCKARAPSPLFLLFCLQWAVWNQSPALHPNLRNQASKSMFWFKTRACWWVVQPSPLLTVVELCPLFLADTSTQVPCTKKFMLPSLCACPCVADQRAQAICGRIRSEFCHQHAGAICPCCDVGGGAEALCTLPCDLCQLRGHAHAWVFLCMCVCILLRMCYCLNVRVCVWDHSLRRHACMQMPSCFYVGSTDPFIHKYIRRKFSVFSREITVNVVKYGVYIWPTLYVCVAKIACE